MYDIPIPLSEAARRLGISTGTLRKAIRYGSLSAERHEYPRGAVYLVSVVEVERYRREHLGQRGPRRRA